jgi:hypothetical protein
MFSTCLLCIYHFQSPLYDTVLFYAYFHRTCPSTHQLILLHSLGLAQCSAHWLNLNLRAREYQNHENIMMVFIGFRWSPEYWSWLLRFCCTITLSLLSPWQFEHGLGCNMDWCKSDVACPYVCMYKYIHVLHKSGKTESSRYQFIKSFPNPISIYPAINKVCSYLTHELLMTVIYNSKVLYMHYYFYQFYYVIIND